ncbi:MAG: hypothetical protein JKX71_12680 [Amylibacter sp.]|nr:hypothetical protein [Amylibacter sp.]
MQDRYVGDVGDFAKYSLLNHLSKGMRLGVAWYLYPDEAHNSDGKHISYLLQPKEWRHRDPFVFDSLKELLDNKARSISAIEQSGVLNAERFSSSCLQFSSSSPRNRSKWRYDWFDKTLNDIDDCNIVFADPDNGLCEDDKFKYCNVKSWKRLPISEAKALSEGRVAIFYHHNSRRKGGHTEEIQFWMNRLSASCAIRFRAFSSRTFFIVNATEELCGKAENWSQKFHSKAEFIRSNP